MALFRQCPYCGANLDPGETCDCGQKEEAALRGANTEDGKRNKSITIIS